MESLALFIANDNFNRKTEGDNYNLRHFDVHIDKLHILSNSIITFNDKIIGKLEMSIGTHHYKRRDNKLTIDLYLIIKSFYEDFDHDHLKGLLNHLHLDHSENLVIPKLSHDHRKWIKIRFTKRFSMDDFNSITVFKSEEEKRIRLGLGYSNLYRNEIDLKQKQDFLFSFFRNPSYDFENIFVFQMKEFNEIKYFKISFEINSKKFRKCELISSLLKFISNEIDKYDDHIYQFVYGLYKSYNDYFWYEKISEEEFVKKFYDWKNNQHWIKKEIHINDENFQYLLNLLLWMDEYLEDERKEVLGY